MESDGNKIFEGFKKDIDDIFSDDKLSVEKIDKFGYDVAKFQYEHIILKFQIPGADFIADLIEWFIPFAEKEHNKIQFLAFLLNKHYPGKLQEFLDETVELENYELSAVLVKLLDVKDMPSKII